MRTPRILAVSAFAILVGTTSCREQPARDGGVEWSADAAAADGTVHDGDEADGDEADGASDVVVPGLRRAVGPTAMAIDSSGVRRVAFFDDTHRELRVASRPPGGEWSESTVAEKVDTSTAGVVDLELDADDHPHVAWATQSRLAVASYDGSGWSDAGLDQTRAFQNHSVDLEIGPEGDRQLLHVRRERLVYYRETGESWEKTRFRAELDGLGTGDEFTGARLERGPGGAPHVFFARTEPTDDLQIARRRGGSWSLLSAAEQIDGPPIVGDIQVEDDRLELSYALRDPAAGDAEFVVAERRDGAWERESKRIEPAPSAIRAIHRPDSGSGRMVYAVERGERPADHRIYWARERSDGWETSALTADEVRASVPSAQIANTDGGSVAWVDRRYGNLNWGVRERKGWSVEPIQHDERRVLHVSGLAFGADGRARVGYLDQTADEHRVANATEDGWRESEVAVDVREPKWQVVGPVVDGNGRTVAAFVDEGGALKAATRGTDGWTTTAVDSGVSEGSTALRVDGAGTAHLAYVPAGGEGPPMMLARYAGREWKVEPVAPPNADAWTLRRLALGADGQVHVAGTKQETENEMTIVYGRRNESEWQTASVTRDATRLASVTEFALGKSGDPHLVYTRVESDTGKLTHAHRADSEWRRNPVPESWAVPDFDVELIRSPSGRLHAVVAGSESVRVAVWEDGEWSEREVSLRSSSAELGPWAAAFDPSGALHIAYSNTRTDNLAVISAAE